MSGLRYIANFDSATAMMRALANALHDKSFPMLGQAPFAIKPAAAVNWLPKALRQQLYSFGGWIEAIPPEAIDTVESTEMAEWIVRQYPDRQYPAVMVGSSNGAAMHLCTALGIPWLPQTLLVPIRHHGVHPDEPRYSLEAFRSAGRRLLERNPDLQLHHMHDANQDRLMIRRMGYFRVKRRTLGAVFERFLRRNLASNGVIYLLDCQLKWPVTQVDERHYFQHGALGGATVTEYFEGGPRVEEFLARYGSHRCHWDPPMATGQAPEAEWGFEQTLAEDVLAFAHRHNFHVKTLRIAQPEDLSPVVANLYRIWNANHNDLRPRLVIDSFILMDPWLTLASGAIPFWTVFNVDASADALDRYLRTTAWDEIFLMLFSHGVESIGVAPIARWKDLLARAAETGAFLGVDEKAYPLDFATFIRYQPQFKRRLPIRKRRSRQLRLQFFEELLAETAGESVRLLALQ